MEGAALGRLFAHWVNDPLFRWHMQQDPAAAILRFGIELSETEWAVVHNTNWNLAPDREADSRTLLPGPALPSLPPEF